MLLTVLLIVLLIVLVVVLVVAGFCVPGVRVWVATRGGGVTSARRPRRR